MTSCQAEYLRSSARWRAVAKVCRALTAFGIGSYAIVWSGLHPCTGVALAVYIMHMGRELDR
jgi:hypothetical protein